MPAKLIMLYPTPKDPAEFERRYHAEHMPLMRRLVGPDVPLPTWKVHPKVAELTGIYRVSEIVFPDRASLEAALAPGRIEEGRRSAERLSTGGPPTALIVNQDEPGV